MALSLMRGRCLLNYPVLLCSSILTGSFIVTDFYFILSCLHADTHRQTKSHRPNQFALPAKAPVEIFPASLISRATRFDFGSPDPRLYEQDSNCANLTLKQALTGLRVHSKVSLRNLTRRLVRSLTVINELAI